MSKALRAFDFQWGLAPLSGASLLFRDLALGFQVQDCGGRKLADMKM